MNNRDRRRRLGNWLIERSLRFSPVEARDWGRAMLAELEFVESSWAALTWGAGGASVLWRQTLFAFFRGSRGAAAGPSGGFIPAKEIPMRKSVFTAGAACVIVSLAFFLAPSFNQALDLSLRSWAAIFRRNVISQSELNGLAARAEKLHDATLLAFTALLEAHYGSSRKTSARRAESLRLAHEAVRLDPRLTWIYAGIALGDPTAPESNDLIIRLQQWDPDNAMPGLLMAGIEKAFVSREHNYRLPAGALAEDPKWLAAMQAAFSAKKYDSYFDRRLVLVQDVARSGEVNDLLLLASAVVGSPIPDLESVRDYARLIIKKGQAPEAQGKLKAAAQEYWQVARLGQTVQLGAQTDIERLIAFATQQKAYERLKSLDLRLGNEGQANLLGYQLQALARERRDLAAQSRERMDWMRTELWIAGYVQLSAFGLLLAALLLAIAGLYWLARRWRRIDAAGRLKLLYSWLGTIGTLGMLLSSVGLYLSYRPYAAMLNQFVALKGAAAYFSADTFLAFIYPQMVSQRVLFAGLWRVYLWDTVIVLCAVVLVAAAARHWIKRARLHPSGQSL